MVQFFLPIPPSVNALFRGGYGKNGKSRRYKSQRYRDWLVEAGWSLKIQNTYSIGGPIRARYVFRFKDDKRRRDVANYEKAVSDLLVAMGIIDDDSRIVSCTLEKAGPDSTIPIGRVAVELTHAA